MVVFHIDLNAFFATAEMIRNPDLVGKPIVVGGRGRKGVVCTASYEARQFGVRSAMPIFEAKKCCKDLIVVKGDFSLYEELSEKFIDFIKEYSNQVEQASIDECYADMSATIQRYQRPLDLAMEIQTRLHERYGLTCSIGIAPNKFLAKIASDLKKPMGITVLRKREIQGKLWPLPIEAMGGIGKKTSPQLKQHGIHTIGDFCKDEHREVILSILGNTAITYLNYAWGIDDSRIINNHSMISMSQSTTLDQDITDYDTVKNVFSKLIQSLCRRIQEEQVCGDNISISIRYYNFETITRSKKLDHYVESYEEIYAEAMMLFDLHDKELPIRHLGIGLNHLKSNVHVNQVNLFNFDQQPQHKGQTDAVIAQLNQQLQSTSIIKLSDLVQGESKFKGVFRK